MVDALITCHSYGGNGMLSHYYHFFFACLLPLIDFRFLTSPSQQCYLSADMLSKLGPFHHTLTHELSLCAPLSEMIAATNGHDYLRLQPITLPAYDIYDTTQFVNSSVPRFNATITLPVVLRFFNGMTAKRRQPTRKTIILIERGVEPFYKQNTSNTQCASNHLRCTSGSSRRNIRNHEALLYSLKFRYDGTDGAYEGVGNGEYAVQSLSLEGMGLVEQFSLFNTASLIIAQHGAAMSNMVFMNTSVSHIVEISPPYSRKAKYFRNLAGHLGVSYSSVLQVTNSIKALYHGHPLSP